MTTPRKPAMDPDDKDRRSEQPKEDEVDETVEETFPASDPPSWSGITGVEEPGEHNGKKPG